MRSDVGRRCQPALGGGSVWARMAAAAATRGTRGGKSQGLSPASLPPRQGAQLYPPDAARSAEDHRLSRHLVPTPRFCPPPPRQGAPLCPGPHRRLVVPGLSRGPRHPHCPRSLRARGLCSAATLLHPSVRAGGGTLPSWSSSRDHCPAGGPRPTPRPGGLPSWDCAPAPGADSSPQPWLHCTQSS